MQQPHLHLRIWFYLLKFRSIEKMLKNSPLTIADLVIDDCLSEDFTLSIHSLGALK